MPLGWVGGLRARGRWRVHCSLASLNAIGPMTNYRAHCVGQCAVRSVVRCVHALAMSSAAW
eukprot:6318625-Pyramimonas_sp.AAC.1